jgi:hypothetical protein
MKAMRAPLLLSLLFAALPAAARASALGELCANAGAESCPRGKPRSSPSLEPGAFFPDAGGWLVEGRCLKDKRFSAAELRSALAAAARKLSPGVPVSAGGCLSLYNPGWARDVGALLRSGRVRLTCPEPEPGTRACADFSDDREPERGGVIRILNVGPCLAEAGTGLAGVIFHETLHAARADNLPLEEHNKAGELPQYVFVTDRIYGTESLCFLGVDPAKRRSTNLLQCLAAIRYENDRPERALCGGFGTDFYDTIPPGFLKH